MRAMTRITGGGESAQKEPADKAIELSDDRALQKKGYTLGKVLGAGAFGEVRSALYNDGKGREDVLAVKIIFMSRLSKSFVTKFFPRELAMQLTLDHPTIVRTHSIVQRADKVFIFMQFLPNGDVYAYIDKNGPLMEYQANYWSRQLWSGTEYMQRRQIVHRDMKVDNLMLTMNYNIKIIDMGFARRVVNQNGQKILSQTYCGTIHYCAPEVLDGIPYNPKLSDNWSNGVIMYILVNGSMPFSHKEGTTVMVANQLKRNWSHRTKVAPLLSREFKDLLQNILEPDVKKRFHIQDIMQHPWMSRFMFTKLVKQAQKQIRRGGHQERRKKPIDKHQQKEMRKKKPRAPN
ncbi:unnamed protein product [Cyprideis torosa]|uniref:Protein kinase domain-containing protein n=1 Tax=Cyprideis torosa TaxID=163714 RepID=A0A7R8ZHW7_9CRUS|nr:unnamed protein product [Cyprideis torosa]CAG0883456.1 unnamed protein product [Cyprideis torosa]